ncbi:GntR family transcriptional regulator [Paenibacillus tarimensis]
MPVMPPLLPPQQRKTLGDQVYDSIRESIVTLRLKPGSMVYENELADRLQVSRTPVREAIRLLLNEQLLDVLPQRGTRIARISERKVNDTRFIREHLELGAFREAARLWNGEKHGEVKATVIRLLEKQQSAADQKDIALFMQLDEAFHEAIIRITGNTTLLQVIYHMRGHLNRLRFLALTEFHHMDRVIDEHKDLFSAIERNDETLAAERLERHLNKLDYELPQLRKAYPDYFMD